MQEEKISLSPRLKVIANWVEQGCRFADIGTDHGYLPVNLIQQGRISSAIAADIKEGPLNTAKRTAEKQQVTLDLRLCDGLSAVSPQEVDCVAIAGMGGITITQILEQWQKKYPSVKEWKGSFLLQAMSTQKDLRFFLNQQGYTIQQEKTICEGDTLYTAMKVILGVDSTYSEIELLVGRQKRETLDENRLLLLSHYLDKMEKILNKLDFSTEEQRERSKAIQTQQNMLLEMRKECESWQQ